MAAVISCLSVASIRARLWVIALALAEGEVLVAHVAARAGGSIDGSAKFLRTGVAVDGWWWCGLVVRCLQFLDAWIQIVKGIPTI